MTLMILVVMFMKQRMNQDVPLLVNGSYLPPAFHPRKLVVIVNCKKLECNDNNNSQKKEERKKERKKERTVILNNQA